MSVRNIICLGRGKPLRQSILLLVLVFVLGGLGGRLVANEINDAPGLLGASLDLTTLMVQPAISPGNTSAIPRNGGVGGGEIGGRANDQFLNSTDMSNGLDKLADISDMVEYIASDFVDVNKLLKKLEGSGFLNEKTAGFAKELTNGMKYAGYGFVAGSCVTELLQENKPEFVAKFNDLVRQIVIDLTDQLAKSLGGGIGAIIGALCGGIGAAPGEFIGGIVGGLVGSMGAAVLYDTFIDDWVKNIADSIYNHVYPDQSDISYVTSPNNICSDLTYAAFSVGAYREKDGVKLLPDDVGKGWSELALSDKANRFADAFDWVSAVFPLLEALTSLRANVYEHKNDDGVIDEVVLSFRGTELYDLGDWINNFLNGSGGISPQYTEAAALGLMLRARYPRVKLTITGHSLGGGLAQYVAAVTNSEAVTFNPASPSKLIGQVDDAFDKTFNDGYEEKITNYIHENDLVHSVNTQTDDQIIIGTKTLGDDVIIPGSEKWLDSHSMATMWDYFADTCIASDGSSGGSGGEEKKVEDDNPEEDKGEDGSSKPSPGIILPPITPQPLIPPIPGGTLPPGSDIGKPKKPGGSLEYQRHKKYDVFVK